MRKRTEALIFLASLPVLFVLLMGALLAVLPLLTNSATTAPLIRGLLSHVLATEVSFDRIHLDYTNGLTVAGLKIANPPGFGGGDLLRCQNLAADADLTLSGPRKARIKLHIAGLTGNVIQTEKDNNISAFIRGLELEPD
ncbi:MAG: hypothetical protein OEV91_08640, partial [Desulfobulbaceae bacterium]|nr:hypothetical protein [Desulfobulbaceae bacterium]